VGNTAAVLRIRLSCDQSICRPPSMLSGKAGAEVSRRVIACDMIACDVIACDKGKGRQGHGAGRLKRAAEFV